jgi:pantoate--beta-alanine ligase
MKVIQQSSELQIQTNQFREERKTIGLVPTMGFLHEGHLSLIRRCKELSDIVVVSVFVNPIQFGPNEDLDAYPRDLERDLNLCEALGVDIVFTPSPESMYGANHSTYIDEEISSLGLCGKSRPGHFKGVLTVCCKLFNLSSCHIAVFGQKDAQQVSLIEKMVRELDMRVDIVRVPTSREKDGLARSSRNKYLSEKDRAIAPELQRTLAFGESLILEQGLRDGALVREKMIERLSSFDGLKVDYLEVVDRVNLQPSSVVEQGQTLLAGAIYIGKTRLIDNLEV